MVSVVVVASIVKTVTRAPATRAVRRRAASAAVSVTVPTTPHDGEEADEQQGAEKEM
jgi:hypothetical protein